MIKRAQRASKQRHWVNNITAIEKDRYKVKEQHFKRNRYFFKIQLPSWNRMLVH